MAHSLTAAVHKNQHRHECLCYKKSDRFYFTDIKSAGVQSTGLGEQLFDLVLFSAVRLVAHGRVEFLLGHGPIAFLVEGHGQVQMEKSALRFLHHERAEHAEPVVSEVLAEIDEGYRILDLRVIGILLLGAL